MSQEHTGTAPVSSPTQQKQALLEAFDTVLKKQAEEREAEVREAEARRRNRNQIRPSVLVLAVFSLALCGYLYFARPDWLFPTVAHPETVAVKEASLRLGMANVAQHVERYRVKHGKLPATLADAGLQSQDISYQPVDTAAWRLTGSHEGIELTLTSQDRIAGFVGNSFEVISRRPR